MYGIFSEWDLGVSEKLFSSEDSALEYVAQLWLDHELDNELEMSFKEAFQDGLIGTTKYKVVE